MNLFKESLEVRNVVLNDLKRISGWDFKVYFNDLYERKDSEVRRLKGSFISDGWIDKEVWMKWKEELENIDYGVFKVEFSNVNKVLSVGGWKNVNRNREMYVENGNGSIEDFNNMFNSKDYFYIIRIIWKK
jgi:hypothetical protein